MGVAIAWARGIVVAAALCLGAFMLIDGTRALVVGDYFTPRDGAYAGQLGPWARVTAAVGLEPRGRPMKLIFVTLGAAWLVAVIAFLGRAPWAPTALGVLAVGTLWYLPVGTILALIVLALLAWLRTQAPA